MTDTTTDLDLVEAIDLVAADYVNADGLEGRSLPELIADVRADREISHDEVAYWRRTNTVNSWTAHAYHMVIDATDDEINAAMPS